MITKARHHQTKLVRKCYDNMCLLTNLKYNAIEECFILYNHRHNKLITCTIVTLNIRNVKLAYLKSWNTYSTKDKNLIDVKLVLCATFEY